LRPRRHLCITAYAGWLTVHARRHPREVCPLAGGVLSQPLSGPLQVGIRFLPPPLPAALSGRLAAPLPVDTGEQRAYHVPRVELLGGLGRASTPVVQHLRVPSSERHNLTTYLLVQACQHLWLVLCDDANGASPGLTLPPDPGPRPPWCWQSPCRLARSRPGTALPRDATRADARNSLTTSLKLENPAEDTLSRELRTPPFPATHVPVGYNWQNSW
jgi:hypothetical protein